MVEALDQCRADLDSINRRLRRVEAQHVNTEGDKEAVRAVVHGYFTDHRQRMVDSIKSEDDLGSLDQAMQDLLRCAQRRTRVSEYRNLVRAAQGALNRLETKVLEFSVGVAPRHGYGLREERILETLQKVHPQAALSYEQALTDLSDHTRKSWRGTAVEFREALREILDTLAPDNEVESAHGFRTEASTKGPTMKQKTAFILRSRRLAKPQAKAAGDAADAVDETVGRFVRSVYDRASAGVHTGITREEVLRVREYVTVVLAELLEVGE